MFACKTFKFAAFSSTRAQSIKGSVLNRYFNRSESEAFEAKQQFEEKLSIEATPSRKQAIRIINQRPQIYIPESAQHSGFVAKVEHLKQLSGQYELAQVMLRVLYKNRYVFGVLGAPETEQLCRLVEQDYGFDKTQVSQLFGSYWRTINPKLPFMLSEKFTLLKEYLQMSADEIKDLLVMQPFLLPASTQRIKQTIVLFLSQGKRLPRQMFGREQIVRLLHEYPEIFLMGRHQIQDLMRFYAQWDISTEELWGTVLRSPILLNNFPYEVMPLKRRLFRYFNFTTSMGRLMLTKYPLVLVSSVSSLEAKLVFIRDRLNLPVDHEILELLQFKFSDLRPRGQILVRAKQHYTSSNIVSFMKCSEEEFASQLGISAKRLQEQKQKFPQTDEIDLRRRKVLSGSNVHHKTKSKVEQMREQIYQAS